MSYRIGSFNIRKLNLERSKESKKDFTKIAEILRKYRFDIIAIQEAISKTAVEAIVRELGYTYSFAWDQPRRALNGSIQEGFAFIWNNRRFSLSKREKESFDNPRIIENYRVKKQIGQANLARDPFIAWFSPFNNPVCEIALINTHIVFSANWRDSDWGEDSFSSQVLRQKEFEVLTQSIYRDIAYRPVPGKCLYTILLGDYNLRLGSKFLPHEVMIDDRSIKRTILTVQEELTTIKRPPKEGEEPATFYWSNNYDHFSFDKEILPINGISVSRINTVLDCKDYIEHNVIISDHVPICLDIDFRA